jgi:hypothetical protein
MKRAEDASVVFIDRIAERRSHENHLSDALYALCHAVPRVMSAVAAHFELAKTADLDLLREFYLDRENRVDFAFFSGGSQPDDKPLCLVEVKLGDRDYHPSYADIAKAKWGDESPCLMLVTNHAISDGELRKLLHPWRRPAYLWSGLIRVIESVAKEELDDIERALVAGFAEYARAVCGLRSVPTVELDLASLRSLSHFHELIGQALKGVANEKNRSDACGGGWTGRYFTIDAGEYQYVAWIGLSYNRPNEKVHLSVIIESPPNGPEIVASLRAGRDPEGLFRIDSETQWEAEVGSDQLESFSSASGSDAQRAFLHEIVLTVRDHVRSLHRD